MWITHGQHAHPQTGADQAGYCGQFHGFEDDVGGDTGGGGEGVDEGVAARSHWDAPEIDGNVYLEGNAGLALGDRLEVLVEDADEYNLYARPAGAKPKQPKPDRAAKAPLAPSH